MPLTDVPKKIVRARSKLRLPSHEQILAGCSTMPRGGMRRHLAGAAVRGAVGPLGFGAFGGMDGKHRAEAGGVADRYVGGQNFLVSTDLRLMMIKVNHLGRAGDFASHWAWGEVTAISVEHGKLTHPMTINFYDGSVLELDGERGSNPHSLAYG